jgi:Tfp pilus assembly protein PilN
MITINLLPVESKKKNYQWVAQSLLILGLLIIFAGVVGVHIFLRTSLAGEKNRIKDLDAKIEVMKPQVEDVLNLEHREAILQTKAQIINELVINRKEWAPNLHELAGLLPERAWLEKLYMDQEIKTITLPTPTPSTGRAGRTATYAQTKSYIIEYLMLDGVTDDLGNTTAVVGQFMSNIENSELFKYFESVSHDTSKIEKWEKGSKDSPEVWRFTLKLKLKGDEPEEI